MSTTIIYNAKVFSDLDLVRECARIGWDPVRAMYVPVLIIGPDTVEQSALAEFNDALALCVAHADELDATVVPDKATTFGFIKQLQEKDVKIADLQAKLDAETQVKADLQAQLDDAVAEVKVP